MFDVSSVFRDVAPMRGKESIRRYWHELRETWAELRLDPVEVFDAGDGRYVADLRLWGKGQRSGAEVEQRMAMLYQFRAEDEKAISIRCSLTYRRRSPKLRLPSLATRVPLWTEAVAQTVPGRGTPSNVEATGAPDQTSPVETPAESSGADSARLLTGVEAGSQEAIRGLCDSLHGKR